MSGYPHAIRSVDVMPSTGPAVDAEVFRDIRESAWAVGMTVVASIADPLYIEGVLPFDSVDLRTYAIEVGYTGREARTTADTIVNRIAASRLSLPNKKDELLRRTLPTVLILAGTSTAGNALLDGHSVQMRLSESQSDRAVWGGLNARDLDLLEQFLAAHAASAPQRRLTTRQDLDGFITYRPSEKTGRFSLLQDRQLLLPFKDEG